MELEQNLLKINKVTKINKKIKRTSLLAISIIMGTSVLLTFKGPIVIFSLLSSVVPVTSYLFAEISDNLNEKRLIKSLATIRKKFSEVLVNYIELNNKLKLDHPLEIYELYTMLLENGYLSKDKVFEYSSKDYYDLPTFGGAEILKGNGVCRNISPFLDEVYRIKGFKSETVEVNVKPNETMSETLKKIKDEDIPLLEKVENIIIENNIRRGVQANHIVNFVYYEENAYFIDPTNRFVLDKENNNYLVASGLKMKIVYPKEKYNINNKNTESKVQKIKGIYENNTELFECFYEENKYLYNEIINSLEKVNKVLIR